MTDSITITAFYDKDTFRCHRYIIDEGQAVKGTLYIPKDTENVPEEVVIQLKVKEA